MPTKLVRLTDVAAEIVQTYAGRDSMSRGVVAMQGLLREKDREITKLKEIADTLQKRGLTDSNSHGEVFWKQMEELLLRVNHTKYTGSNGFQPAGKLVVTPVKTIGKISDDEKLIEPVGRQGRDVR